jgi:predicted dehydrogenase
MGVSAIRSKKHVMLEKPIARDEEEAIRLIETAKTTGVKFMVLENHYFDPSVWKAKELMEMMGGISLILLRNTRFNSPQGWRRVKDLMGGGALIDGGIHFIDTLLNLGIVDERLKVLAKELGRLRDLQLMAQLCEGKEIDFDVSDLRLKTKDIIGELLFVTEFDRIKRKLSNENNV